MDNFKSEFEIRNENFLFKYKLDINNLMKQTYDNHHADAKVINDFLKLLKSERLNINDNSFKDQFLKTFCLAQRTIQIKLRIFLINSYLNLFFNFDKFTLDIIKEKFEEINKVLLNSEDKNITQNHYKLTTQNNSNFDINDSIDEKIKYFQFFLKITFILLFNEDIDLICLKSNEIQQFYISITKLFMMKEMFRDVIYSEFFNLVLIKGIYSNKNIHHEKIHVFILYLFFNKFCLNGILFSKIFFDNFPHKDLDLHLFLISLKSRIMFNRNKFTNMQVDSNITFNDDEDENNSFKFVWIPNVNNYLNFLSTQNVKFYMNNISFQNLNTLDRNFHLDLIMDEGENHFNFFKIENCFDDLLKILKMNYENNNQCDGLNTKVLSYIFNHLQKVYILMKNKDNNHIMMEDFDSKMDLVKLYQFVSTNINNESELEEILNYLSKSTNSIFSYINNNVDQNFNLENSELSISIINCFYLFNHNSDFINNKFSFEKINFVNFIYNELNKNKFNISYHLAYYLNFLLEQQTEIIPEDFKFLLVSSINDFNLSTFIYFVNTFYKNLKNFNQIQFEFMYEGIITILINILNLCKTRVTLDDCENAPIEDIPDYKLIVNLVKISTKILWEFLLPKRQEIINEYCDNLECQRKLNIKRVIFCSKYIYLCNYCQREHLAVYPEKIEFIKDLSKILKNEELFSIIFKFFDFQYFKKYEFYVQEKYLKNFSFITKFTCSIFDYCEMNDNEDNLNLIEYLKEKLKNSIESWKHHFNLLNEYNFLQLSKLTDFCDLIKMNNYKFSINCDFLDLV